MDDYLGAHEETLSRLGQQRHAALEKSASLDSILQRRRREHEQEFSSKKQKMEGEVKEAQPDGRAEEVKMQIAAGKERTDALARSREEGCAELAQVEEEIALLHAKMRDARQCDDEDGKSVLTLEAQMRRIEASRESQLLALQDTLKALTGKRGLDGALRKREQLFNNLISFLKQRASNPTEMQGEANPTGCVPTGVGCIPALSVWMLFSHAVLLCSRQQCRGSWLAASNKPYRKILVARLASAPGSLP